MFSRYWSRRTDVRRYGQSCHNQNFVRSMGAGMERRSSANNIGLLHGCFFRKQNISFEDLSHDRDISYSNLQNLYLLTFE